MLIAPGFPAEQQKLTVELMRLDLAAILIFSISGLVMAGLQANQYFLLPALAPGLYNIGQILGVVVLALGWADVRPHSTTRVGSGHLWAGVRGIWRLLHLGIQIPGLLRYGFRWTPRQPAQPAVAECSP